MSYNPHIRDLLNSTIESQIPHLYEKVERALRRIVLLCNSGVIQVEVDPKSTSDPTRSEKWLMAECNQALPKPSHDTRTPRIFNYKKKLHLQLRGSNSPGVTLTVSIGYLFEIKRWTACNTYLWNCSAALWFIELEGKECSGCGSSFRYELRDDDGHAAGFILSLVCGKCRECHNCRKTFHTSQFTCRRGWCIWLQNFYAYLRFRLKIPKDVIGIIMDFTRSN